MKTKCCKAEDCEVLCCPLNRKVVKKNTTDKNQPAGHWIIVGHPNCYPGECGPACQVVSCGIQQGWEKPEIKFVPDA